MRRRPGTSSPRCCRSASAFQAPSTRTPWTGEAGDAAAARDQAAALLPVRERFSGAEHPETLITRGDLARWTKEARDPAAARDQFAALLPVMERVLGPEHPKTLAARGSLARLDRGGGYGRGP